VSRKEEIRTMETQELVLNYLKTHKNSSSKEIFDGLKAMLLFYEQNNISAFKQIFIGQFKFAVENYF
jgi:hypothetical protein